jgi:hypothetical protein
MRIVARVWSEQLCRLGFRMRSHQEGTAVREIAVGGGARNAGRLGGLLHVRGPAGGQNCGTSPAFIRELLRRAALLAADESEGSLRVSEDHLAGALDELRQGGGELTNTLLGARPERASAPPTTSKALDEAAIGVRDDLLGVQRTISCASMR